MATAAAIIGVFVGLLIFVGGLAEAFIPAYGSRGQSPTGGLVIAGVGLCTIIGSVMMLAIR
jgi:hypothetical protein